MTFTNAFECFCLFRISICNMTIKYNLKQNMIYCWDIIDLQFFWDLVSLSADTISDGSAVLGFKHTVSISSVILSPPAGPSAAGWFASRNWSLHRAFSPPPEIGWNLRFLAHLTLYNRAHHCWWWRELSPTLQKEYLWQLYTNQAFSLTTNVTLAKTNLLSQYPFVQVPLN